MSGAILGLAMMLQGAVLPEDCELQGGAGDVCPANYQGRWMTNNDYPIEAIRAAERGVVRFQLVVGTDGRARDCLILASSGHTPLDEAVCATISARARFVPPRDGAGAPVEGSFISWVTFQLPGGGPDLPRLRVFGEPYAIDMSFVVAEGSGITQCAVAHWEPGPFDAEAFCRGLEGQPLIAEPGNRRIDSDRRRYRVSLTSEPIVGGADPDGEGP